MLQPAKPCGLIDRLILSNQYRENPYDLWFIKPETIAKHETALTEIKILTPVKNLWAFYLPVKECPLTYWELSVWFLLCSIAQRKHLPVFQQAFTGIEAMLGLSHDQASKYCNTLKEHKLIDIERTEGWPWFAILNFETYAHWFKSSGSKEMPSRFAAMLEQEKNLPLTNTKPELTDEQQLLILNKNVTCHKSGHFFDAVAMEQFWTRQVKKGAVPKYDDKDLPEVERLQAKIKSKELEHERDYKNENKRETNNERNADTKREEIDEEIDDDFITRLRNEL